MSSQSKWKLLTVLIVASVLLGVVGWQQFAPKPVPPTTVMITPTATTASATQTSVSASQTTVTHRETEWIRIGEVRPVSYYLSLLESNGTAPYGQLYWELRKLPSLTNATAVAKITYLALNATNPEVKEAFELMIKGGTPYPRDFKYSVPDYNTELQVLYWLACQNEFKKDDTLALSIALVNGLWVTTGDQQVREAVRRDSADLLIFFRETNELQKQKGYCQLEDYPLEAKVCLTWTGSRNVFSWKAPHRLINYGEGKRQDMQGYEWNTVSLGTLREARQWLAANSLVDKNADKFTSNIEQYLWFDGIRHTFRHWDFISPEKKKMIVVDGETVWNLQMNNVDYQWRLLKETGKGLGVCEDESGVVDMFLKSTGFASNNLEGNSKTGKGHTYTVYFVPEEGVWRAYAGHLYDDWTDESVLLYFVFKPPINLGGYLRYGKDDSPNALCIFQYHTTISEIRQMFAKGVPTSQMKQWLLYG